MWIGRPFFSISIVTRAWPLPFESGSTSVTLPTSTPAIRTGDFGCRLFADSKVACSMKGWANGLYFVKPKKLNTATNRTASNPALKGVIAGLLLARTAIRAP